MAQVVLQERALLRSLPHVSYKHARPLNPHRLRAAAAFPVSSTPQYQGVAPSSRQRACAPWQDSRPLLDRDESMRSRNSFSLRLQAVATSDAQAVLETGGGGGTDGPSNNGGGGGGGGGGDGGFGSADEGSTGPLAGILNILLKGWRDRVAADSQFVFKVLTEQIIGVTACVLGDMASRPNFGLNELDFVFSTLVVGSILNFLLMYLLAPVASTTASGLPGIFSSCPDGHMFQPGSYNLFQRAGTFVFKGAQFATVGFLAGLVGTLLTNTLLEVRKKMDPEFVSQNEAPPTVLNAATWALHLGISSNLRYQALNGLDLFLTKALPATVFRPLVFVIRGLNNVIGGASFAMLAKATGAQKSASAPAAKTDPVLQLSSSSTTSSPSQETAAYVKES